MSDLLDVFSATGRWIETAAEPQLPEGARNRYPHKQTWMDNYLGTLIFTLRPLHDHEEPHDRMIRGARPIGPPYWAERQSVHPFRVGG